MISTLKKTKKNIINKKRYQELDALRGIAAIMVVLFHFTMWEKDYNKYFRLGNTGVDLFFIISGFVIFMSLQRISNAKEFIISRISRLYPTYWTAVTFTFLLLTALHIKEDTFSFRRDVISYLGNLTMFQFYLRIQNLDGPYWTLIIEILFYIFIITLYALKLLKYIIPISIFLCALTSISTCYFYEIYLVKVTIKGLPLLQYMPLFFAGILFYKIHTTNKNSFFLYLLIVLCILCQLTLYPIAALPRKVVSFNEYAIMLCFYFLAFIVLVNNKLKFIVSQVTIFLGKASYALYLIHQTLSIQILIPFLTHVVKLNFWVASLGITLPIVIILAFLITLYIENPLRQIIKNRLHRYIIYS